MLLIFPLTACSDVDDTKISDTIKIGLNYELSGEYAIYGQDSVKGIKLAVKQINANGGINGAAIELIEMDNKSDVKLAKKNQKKLDEQCLVTFGPAVSKLAGEVAEISEDNKVIMITNTASENSVVEDEDGDVLDYVYRICYNDTIQGRAIGEFAISHQLNNGIIIEEKDDIYSQGLGKAITKALESENGTIKKTIDYQCDEFDTNAILESLKESEDYNVIFLNGYYAENAAIINAIRSINHDVMIICSDAMDVNSSFETISEYDLNNVYYTSQFSEDDSSEGVAEFVNAYKVEYQESANAYSASGYEMMQYCAKVLTSLDGDVSIKKFNASFEDYTDEFSGVCGKIKMNKNHTPERNVKIIEAISGDLIIINNE